MCATLEIETPVPCFLIHWQIVCICWTELHFPNRNVVSERWFVFVGKTLVLLFWTPIFLGSCLHFGRTRQCFDPIQSACTLSAVFQEHHALLECLVDLRVLRPETFSASIHRSLGYSNGESPKSPDDSSLSRWDPILSNWRNFHTKTRVFRRFRSHGKTLKKLDLVAFFYSGVWVLFVIICHDLSCSYPAPFYTH